MSVTLLLVAHPDPLAYPIGIVNCELGELVRAYPAAEPALRGLHEAGWHLDVVVREQPMMRSGCSDSLETCAQFSTQLAAATPLEAAEMARACGVVDELSPVFEWSIDPDSGSCWNEWQGEL